MNRSMRDARTGSGSILGFDSRKYFMKVHARLRVIQSIAQSTESPPNGWPHRRQAGLAMSIVWIVTYPSIAFPPLTSTECLSAQHGIQDGRASDDVITGLHSAKTTFRARIAALLAVPMFLSVACSNIQSDTEPANGPAGPETTAVNLVDQEQLEANFEVDDALRALLPDDVRSSGIIRTGTSVGLPPLNFPGSDTSQVRGLNPDLVAGVEQILGVRFESEVYPNTAGQLVALDSGRIQLTTSTNGDTRFRQEKYDFIDYALSTNPLIVKKGNPKAIVTGADVCGLNFGEVKGSTSILPALEQTCTEAGKSNPSLLTFDDIPTMQLALTSGRIDSYVGSDFTVVWDQARGVPIEAVPFDEGGSLVLGWTVTKSEPGIRDAVVGALQKLDEDGYYSSAFERWGVTGQKLDPAVNAGAVAANFG